MIFSQAGHCPLVSPWNTARPSLGGQKRLLDQVGQVDPVARIGSMARLATLVDRRETAQSLVERSGVAVLRRLDPGDGVTSVRFGLLGGLIECRSQKIQDVRPSHVGRPLGLGDAGRGLSLPTIFLGVGEGR